MAVPDKAAVGEYLRVDEIARRFDVTIDDVLAACSLLGFAADNESSLIELDLFTQAVKGVHLPAVAPPRPRRLVVLSAAAAAAAVVASVGAFVFPSRGTSGGQADERTVLAATYRDALQQTFEATVADAPQATDYRALAQAWAELEPPAALAAEHAQLVAEAETVADLASAVDAASTSVDTAAAADALRDHVAELEAERLAPRR